MQLQELYNWAENHHIEIDDFPMRQLTAVSFPEGWIALDTAKLKNAAEEKACLAHELGHCATGSFYNVHSPCGLREREETRAARWAIRVLVPEEELLQAVQHGITEPWELAEFFDVPEAFIRKAMAYYSERKEGCPADQDESSFF